MFSNMVIYYKKMSDNISRYFNVERKNFQLFCFDFNVIYLTLLLSAASLSLIPLYRTITGLLELLHL
jgi:hypothetical protein